MKAKDEQPLYKHKMTRRAVLRGMGATLSLPFLESFMPGSRALAQEAQAGGILSEPPRRFVALVFSNGVNTAHWWQRTGANDQVTKLGSTLQQLEPYRDELLFLNDLHLFDKTVGVHTPFFTNFLVGMEIPQGSVPSLDQSIDQYMAKTVGRATPVPSLVFGIEPTSFGLAGGKPAIYNGTISWSSRTAPITPEIYPRQAFDRLFDTKTLLRDRSVLDFVLSEAKTIRTGLSAPDQAKMDDYLESIRAIERRIDMATAEGRLEGWQPSLLKPNMPRPDEGTPQNIPEHMKLMVDLTVLALQMDKTRVATLLLQRDLSNMLFNFLDGVSQTGLHNLSHHRGQTDALTQYQITNEYHVGIFKYMLDKMKAIDEGNGTTLLDNTAVLFGSTMADGNAHDGDHLKLILAGGKSMGIQGGRSLTYTKLEDRRLCNLHLDLAQRMGCKIEEFSNAHYPLPRVGS